MRDQQPIIIIEDDEDDQEILREVFQALEVRHALHFFNDCNKAFEFLLSSLIRPFLILCDMNLPRMDGIELKQKIDATESIRKKAIPFVFLTTSDTPAMVNRAYHSTSVQGYFKKSDSIDGIKKKVGLILEYWATALQPTVS